MADVLAEICARKRDHVRNRESLIPLDEVKARAYEARPVRGFIRALENKIHQGSIGLIAEIKKASPSKGLIREDFSPPDLARAYARAGAACLSVLTDEPYFQGHDGYLVAARDAVSLPVLRKDFMLTPYQIYESRMLGADCILLIMAALSRAQAQELEGIAFDLGMDVLIEVHNKHELNEAIHLRSRLIGVNNRDLKTLAVDLATTEALAQDWPAGRILVAESGIYSPADIARMRRIGAHCFLIGESLMRQTDVEAATRALLAEPAKTT